MEEELRMAPVSYRNAMGTKLRMYRRDLGKLQRDMKNSAPGFGSSSSTVQGSQQGIYSSQNQHSVSDGLCAQDYVLWQFAKTFTVQLENNDKITAINV